MYIRDEVRERWAADGVLDLKHLRVQEFLKYISDHPLECWDDYITVFREQYYDLFDVLVRPLLKSRDKMLRTILIAKADLSKAPELDALKQLVRDADPVTDQAELLAIARRGAKVLLAEMERHGKMVPQIAEQLRQPGVRARPATNIRRPRPKKRKRASRAHVVPR